MTVSTQQKQQQDKQDLHVSLYRKYRPTGFEQVVGQDHIVSVLKQAVEGGSPAHAYLFCGGRGIGKTSVARIFARALGTSENDIYEIDAASHTSVENIRELNEAVNTLPFNSKYKVYILDEVHMLSKSAFNAFLKTLEEPPKHVIFILATTEMDKLPETIVSRCQSFIFRKPTIEILKSVIANVAKSEKIKISADAVELVAILGDGSFRDTLGMLQKVAGTGEDISREMVENITGSPRHKMVGDFVNAMLAKKTAEAMNAIEEAVKQNSDMKVFTDLSLIELRRVMLGEVSNVGALPNANQNVLQIRRALYALLTARARIDSSSIPQLPLELAILEVTA